MKVELRNYSAASVRHLEWEVSITLAPEARGLGLSSKVLDSGHNLFDQRYPGATVIAAILPTNTPSQKLFTRAGYARFEGHKDGEFDVLIRRDPS